MANEKEHTGRTRTLLVLRMLFQSPFIHTIKRIAEKQGVSTSTIKEDFEAIKNAGFEIEFDEMYRYGLVADRALDSLKELLVFSTKEENLMMQALQNLGEQDEALKKLKIKLSRIYDVSRFHNTFDKNFLTKMDKLEKAKKEQKVIILCDYHSSNSSTVTNRNVEVFHISAEDDIVHAFDLDIRQIRHFRISRISKLKTTETNWTNTGSHNVKTTDCFRIHDNNQVPIHLQINVSGYNALLETFPITRAYLKPADGSANTYDFECKVNHQFYGLTNFIMGNHHSVTAILEPQSLINHIQDEAKKLLEKKY
jgi:predicted DNA-binding transcriptional regulator YafY